MFEPKNEKVNIGVFNLAKDRGFDDFWIGINDKSQEGNFVYASDDTPIIWNNWANGQPDNGAGPGGNQDCAQIEWGSDGTWDDDYCSNLFSFVCERGK